MHFLFVFSLIQWKVGSKYRSVWYRHYAACNLSVAVVWRCVSLSTAGALIGLNEACRGGDTCRDVNAACLRGFCRCRSAYFERRGVCGITLIQLVTNHWQVSEWVSSVLHPHQHSIGYTGDGFYRSKDPTNSIKVLKENLQKRKKTTKTTKYRYT